MRLLTISQYSSLFLLRYFSPIPCPYYGWIDVRKVEAARPRHCAGQLPCQLLELLGDAFRSLLRERFQKRPRHTDAVCAERKHLERVEPGLYAAVNEKLHAVPNRLPNLRQHAKRRYGKRILALVMRQQQRRSAGFRAQLRVMDAQDALRNERQLRAADVRSQLVCTFRCKRPVRVRHGRM